MTDRYITGASGYLPIQRMNRGEAVRALRFVGGPGKARGLRAVAGWDEDPVTMAVEAGRRLAGGFAPDCVTFGSTSAPYFDRSHAALAVEALALSAKVRSNDVAGSRRCAVSALLEALISTGDNLILAAEKRPTRPGSAQHLFFGDGAAAVRVGDVGGARFIGHASLAHDFVDFYASRELPTGYAYEDRFVRETAVRKLIVPTILDACEAAAIDPSAITHAAVHEPLPGLWSQIAKEAGLTATNRSAELEVRAGDLGAAHALFSFALALDEAKVGDIILLAGFGSGCDALLFEVTSEIAESGSATAALNEGQILLDYVRFLALTETLDLDGGVRAEFEQKAQATVLERLGRDTIGFIGGRDGDGNVQFPKSRIPVRPGAAGPEAMSDIKLSDCAARLLSVTADRLNYTPDPPFWFGLVQFDNGARVLMELTDAPATGFAVGDELTMRFRVKSYDRRRGSRSYFWKAAPAARPALES